MPGMIAEIVRFRLDEGVTEAKFSKAAAEASAFLKARRGFISRTLSRSNDGTYLDHVIWASKEDAEDAARAFSGEPSLHGFMISIDPNSMQLEHHYAVESVSAVD